MLSYMDEIKTISIYLSCLSNNKIKEKDLTSEIEIITSAPPTHPSAVGCSFDGHPVVVVVVVVVVSPLFVLAPIMCRCCVFVSWFL